MNSSMKAIKIRETLTKWAKSYTFFCFSIFLLEVFRFFMSGREFRAGSVLVIINAVLLGSAVVLWMGCGILTLYIHVFSWERRYQALLRRFFICPEAMPFVNFGVVFDEYLTLTLFPSISPYDGYRNKVWGWDVGGRIRWKVCGERMEDSVLCLTTRPKVFSEQITMDLKLAAKKPDDLNFLPPPSRQANENRQRLLVECFRNHKIGFDAPIHGECILLSSDGKLVSATSSSKMTWRISLKGAMLKCGDEFCEPYFMEVRDALATAIGVSKDLLEVQKIGILSLYLNQTTGEVGFCTLVQLKNSSADLACEKISFVKCDDERDCASIVSNMSIRGESRYCLLIYAYAQMDIYAFAERLLAKNRLKTVISLWGKREGKSAKQFPVDDLFESEFKDEMPSAPLMGESQLYIRTPWKDRIKNFFHGFFRYRLIPFVARHAKGISIATLSFVFGNLIEPVLTNPNLATFDVSMFPSFLSKTLSTRSLLPLLLAFTILLIAGLASFVNYIVLKRQRPFLAEGCSLFGNCGIFCAKDCRGADIANVEIRVTDQTHPFPEGLRVPEIYIADNDDGIKYVLSDCQLSKGSIVCTLDQCLFSDTQAVQRMIKKEKGGTLRILGKDYENQLDQYRQSLSKLRLGQRITSSDRENLPPNSLCAHALVMTSDGYVVVMKRDAATSYYSKRYSVSIEEQMSDLDVFKGKVCLRTWIERMCEEEFGITRQNTNCDSLGNIYLMSIFEEKEILNIALCIYIRLKVSKAQLQYILRYFPRKDYEGFFAFVRMEDLWNHYVKTILAGRNMTYHSSAIYRIFWASICERRFDIVDRIRALARDVEEGVAADSNATDK